MSTCPGCGAQVMVGNTVCGRCRKLLTDDSDFPPSQENRQALASIGDADAVVTRKVWLGRCLLVLALAISFFDIMIGAGLGEELGLVTRVIVGVTYLCLALGGMWILARALGYGVGLSIFLCLMTIVPLVSLFVMIVYCVRATTELREAGYSDHQ